jgi:hypothetical protein
VDPRLFFEATRGSGSTTFCRTQRYGIAQRYTILNCNKICQQIWQEWADIHDLKYRMTHCAHCCESHASMTICTNNFGTEVSADLTGFGQTHKDYKGISVTLIPRLTSPQLTSFVPTPNVLSQERKFANAMLNASSRC